MMSSSISVSSASSMADTTLGWTTEAVEEGLLVLTKASTITLVQVLSERALVLEERFFNWNIVVICDQIVLLLIYVTNLIFLPFFQPFCKEKYLVKTTSNYPYCLEICLSV